MADATAAGYQDVRDYITSAGGWAYLEIQDASGTPHLRVNIVSDARVSWTHGGGAQELEVTAVFTGSDSDVDLSDVFAKSALFKAASGGSSLHTETFAQAFTFNNDADQLTIKHRLQVPTV
jgi:hypothetical protein